MKISEVEAANPSTGKSVINRFAPILLFTGACWAMFVVNNLIFSGDLTQYGIRPRHISSLPGIIWSPFLHTSFRHLSANTIPLLVLGAIICVRSKTEFAAVTTGGILLGGGLTWLLARGAYHVGASGLIFCFFSYLASLAYFNRNIPTLLLSLVCIAGYGGMLRGLVPTSAAVSWEGHLAGFLSGIAIAWGISTSKKTRSVAANGPALVLPDRANIMEPPATHPENTQRS